MRPVYVAGSAVTRSWADASRNLTELIFDGVTAAMTDAGLTMAEVDGVVLAAHDLTDGRGLTSMVTAPAAGAYLKDEVRLGEDGASALALAAARIRGGHSEVCVVAGWGRASEGSPDDIARQLFDPFTARPFGLTELSVSAMRASAALRAFPGYGTWREEVAARRSGLPARQVAKGSYPLQPGDLPVWSDVVATVVLTAAPTAVQVLGVGMSTEPFDIGARDLVGMPALAEAGERALRMAGIGMDAVGIFEVDGLTTFEEALGLEALGVADRGRGMQVLAQSPAVNADGGCAAGYCAPAMGLVRISRAHHALSTGTHRYALATGSSVVAAQTQAAIVLGRTGSE
jgi:acetyl-CoA C-acetyltransferase